MRPILITGAERLFDQQAAKSGAVDEEIGLQALAALETSQDLPVYLDGIQFEQIDAQYASAKISMTPLASSLPSVRQARSTARPANRPNNGTTRLPRRSRPKRSRWR